MAKLFCEMAGGAYPANTSWKRGKLPLERALWSADRLPQAVQLEQVMSETNECPFRCHFGEASKTEAAESALLLDMREDRFDDRLAGGVESTPGCRAKLRSHAPYERVIRTDAGVELAFVTVGWNS